MAETEWLLEFLLVLLLSGTLFYALRLQCALKVLRGDRTELKGLIDALTKSTSEADSSIARLHAAANGIGRELARHNAEALSLKGDLTFLTARAERLADRLDARRRTTEKPPGADDFACARSSCSRSLLDPAIEASGHRALGSALARDRPSEATCGATPASQVQTKSEAERELLRALKMAR